jgi:hypothetical protein
MSESRVFYENSRQLVLRFVQVVLWGGTGIILWLVSQLGQNPRDTLADYIVSGIGALVMVAGVIAYEVYLRLYVVRLEARGANLRFTTLSTFGTRSFEVDPELVYVGAPVRLQTDGLPAPSTDTTHRSLNVVGRKLPLIVDLTMDNDDSRALQRFIRADRRASARDEVS